MATTGLSIVNLAHTLLGAEYVYGASGPATFDCSGLTQFTYGRNGVSIPRTSEEQFKAGTPVDQGNAIPGDLVFFGGQGYDGTPQQPGHVGIYIGGGQMINAPHTGAVVRIDSIDGNVGFRHYGITGDSSSTFGAGLSAGLSAATGGLFSFPAEIVGFFSDADQQFTAFYRHAALFFQPSTYVRIGAGFFGIGFVLTGLILLMREARTS